MYNNYILKVLLEYFKRIKMNGNINKDIQSIYNRFGYGYDDKNDAYLLMALQEYNEAQDVPYLASGQNGYFNEQIDLNGLSNLKLDKQDEEDAMFISNCFGKKLIFMKKNPYFLYNSAWNNGI